MLEIDLVGKREFEDMLLKVCRLKDIILIAWFGEAGIVEYCAFRAWRQECNTVALSVPCSLSLLYNQAGISLLANKRTMD